MEDLKIRPRCLGCGRFVIEGQIVCRRCKNLHKLSDREIDKLQSYHIVIDQSEIDWQKAIREGKSPKMSGTVNGILWQAHFAFSSEWYVTFIGYPFPDKEKIKHIKEALNLFTPPFWQRVSTKTKIKTMIIAATGLAAATAIIIARHRRKK